MALENLSRHAGLLTPLEGLKDFRPQVAGLADGVGHGEPIHALVGVAAHGLEGLDDALEPDGLARGLGGPRLEGDVDDVHVQVVVRGLVVHVELELVRLE